MPSTVPFIERHEVVVPATAANADCEWSIRAPFDSTVTVEYIADTALTGAANDSRTLQAHNRKADGSGTVKMAELALVVGVDLAAYVPKAVTAITAASANVVTEGQIVAVKSLHVGSTGLADPGGTWVVTFTRS